MVGISIAFPKQRVVTGGGTVEIVGGLVPKGAYSAGTDYQVGDSVDYNGSSYVMYVDAPAGTLPTDTTKWQVLASKGNTGDTGATGSQGPQGNPGNDGADGADGQGVPVGGTTAQVLRKIDNTDFNTEWHTPAKGDVGLGNVDNTSDANKPISSATQTALDAKVDENVAITGATKTKITYDAKGLVTGGADATTADVADSLNKRYVTDAHLTILGNTSGTNTGDQNISGKTDKVDPSVVDNFVSFSNIAGGQKDSGKKATDFANSSHTHAQSDVTNLTTDLGNKVTKNADIAGATKTKITYDAKGLVTSGADATQDDIGDGTTYKQYSATEKTKLAGIATGAEVNVNADWNAVSGDAEILNKPTIPTQYTDEMAQDAIGAMVAGSLTYVDATPALSLTNDNAAPGANKVYGTDASGVKGWKADPSGGVSDGDKGDITVSASGATWTIDNGTVTEAKQTLADNTTNNLSTSAHGYAPKAPNDTTQFLRGDATWAAPLFQYTLQAFALNQATTTDSQTMYWGGMNLAPTTTAGNTRIYIPRAGTIKACYIFVQAATAGTNENWSMYIRKNNTTDTLVQTLGANTNQRLFSNTGLNISVAAGDYIEMKEIQPAWATNPANVRRSAVIWID